MRHPHHARGSVTAARLIAERYRALSEAHAVSQRRAQEALAAADADAYRLAQMRFRSGVDNYLATLDAQRSLTQLSRGWLRCARRSSPIRSRSTRRSAVAGSSTRS